MQIVTERTEWVAAISTSETLGSVLDRKGRTVHFVEADATVFEAIERMAARHIGALIVLRDGQLAGVISERDYARKVILQGKSSRQITVEEIMSAPAITAPPSMSVSDGLRLMTHRRIRHLPIVDAASGDLQGVVSIGDLVRCVIQSQAEALEHLTGYIQGSYPA